MKTKNLFKKIIALVLVVTMLIPTISHLGTNVKEVRAEDATTEITDESIGYVIVPSASVNTDGNQPTVKVGYEGNKYSDYLFAGWYTDAEALIASASGGTGAYARFVPADVLSVKVQVTNGLVTDTSINEYRNKYVMRFVSSIDSLDYKNAGFEITYKEGESTITRTNTTTTGFKRIDSSTGSTEKGMDLYEYSPKVISTKSEYFVTAKWALVDTSQKITVKAFWTTKDGTRVYGGSRCVAVEDGVAVDANFEDVKKTNVSFKSSIEYSEGDIINAITYGTNGANTAATVIGCSTNVDGTYTVHTRVDVVPSLLPSVTQFTFGENETAIYRNLLTKYTETTTTEGTTNTADDTWYEVYKDSTEEFVIATSADLYGLASLVNRTTGNVNFTDKTIYIVSDIKVNKGTAKDTGWVAATGENKYSWIPIGSKTNPFAGVFDGQNHIISGLYFETGSQYAGFFGGVKTTGTRIATVENVMLKNSYLKSTAADFGSIAGYAHGSMFDTIKSDAIMVSSSSRIGGFIGTGDGNLSINNCWFTGKVTNTSTSGKKVGGFVGELYGTPAINNCLNSGEVTSAVTTNWPSVSGFIGNIASNTNVTLTDCLNVGVITEVSTNKDTGAIFGATGANCTVNIYTSYIDSSKYGIAKGYVDSSTTIKEYDENNKEITTSKIVIENSALTGDGAKTGLKGFDFNNTWTVVTNGTPVLKSFEDEIINPDISWYSPEGGSAQNPYILYDKDDLYGLALLSQDAENNGFAGKVIRLGADIVVNKGNAGDWTGCAPQYEWTPIGQETAFTGTFDGSDPETGEIHSISGLYLNTSSAYAGLFGQVKNPTNGTAVVQNVKLKNSYFVSSNLGLGSVIGNLNGGEVNNVYSNATVKSTGKGYVGGLIGAGKSTVQLENCWFGGNVTNTGTTTSDRRTSGLLGCFSQGQLTMENCLNTATIDVSAHASSNYPFVGALVGVVGEDAATTVTLTDCLNTGEIKVASASTKYGGTVGYIRANANITVNTTYTDKSQCSRVYEYLDGGSYTVKGPNNEDWTITNVQISHDNIIGDAAKQNLQGFNFEKAWSTVADGTPILACFASNVFVPDTTWYDGDSDTYILYNRADLYGFSKLSQSNNFEGKTVQLGADIVVNEGDAEDWAESAPYYSWMPIGQKTAFEGTFDGADPEDPDVIHSISGLYFETSTKHSGLFGQIAGTDTKIQNLKLTNSYFETSNQNIGSIVGYANGGNIDTVYSDAIVVASKERVGGVIGIGASTVTITNSWFAGKVTNASKMTGGFVGDQNSGSLSMTNCLNTGLVDVSGYATDNYPRAGGLVGNLTKGTVTLDNCLNTGIKCVYDAATTVYGAFTGYLGSSTSLNITQTYADVDKWGSVGYYSVKDKKDDGTPITTYNTLNGKCGNDSEDEIKADLVALLLEHSAVIGDAAKDSLEGFDFDSTWTVLSDGTVALAKFANMKVTDTEKTALHSKLVSSQSLVANSSEPIATLDDPDNYTNLYYQGGCTPDGQYFYQAAITKKDTTEGALEVNNEVKIVRYNLSTGEAVWSDTMTLNHANDITYNSDLDCFVVCHSTGNPTRVSYLKINDAGKLVVVDDDNDGVIDGTDLTYSSYSIDYNATYDRYVVGRSGAEYFDVYDADFNRLYSFEAKDDYKGKLNEDESKYIGNITQGICCDDNYIYCVLDTPDIIVVYDWYGTFVTKIDLSQLVEYEPENVSVVGDTIYVTDVLYYKTNSPILGEIEITKANVYKIDTSALVKDTTAQ